jgi:lipoprotein-releasing system ATP-binding protein
VNEIEILHDISMQLERSQFCALIGPSGSGKSTLLNIIGLLDRPTQGKLWLCGHDTSTLSEHALTILRGQHIGLILQAPHLLSAFTALENVMLPMLAIGQSHQLAIAKRAADLLDAVGLAKWRQSPVLQLSGGQQQRVAIARALIMQPALLLADEPTGNLDTTTATAVFELLQGLSREHAMTVLFVTHNPTLAQRCDSILSLQDGRLTL